MKHIKKFNENHQDDIWQQQFKYDNNAVSSRFKNICSSTIRALMDDFIESLISQKADISRTKQQIVKALNDIKEQTEKSSLKKDDVINLLKAYESELSIKLYELGQNNDIKLKSIGGKK